MDYPVIRLTAKKHSDLNPDATIINCQEIADTFYVELPSWAVSFKLYDILPVSSEIIEPESILDSVQRTNRIWIDIPKEVLNLDSGYHLYRIRLTNDEIYVTLYFNYIIQNNHPDKPYVYMDHNGECACNA